MTYDATYNNSNIIKEIKYRLLLIFKSERISYSMYRVIFRFKQMKF